MIQFGIFQNGASDLPVADTPSGVLVSGGSLEDMHASFQRIMVDTCSISVIHYTPTRPFVARVNDLGGDVAGLIPPKPRRRRRAVPRSSDAVVGGTT